MMEITTQALLERIGCAQKEELNELLTAFTERFREVWPEWDLLTISCEGRTPADHIRTLEQAVRLITTAAKDTSVQTEMV